MQNKNNIFSSNVDLDIGANAKKRHVQYWKRGRYNRGCHNSPGTVLEQLQQSYRHSLLICKNIGQWTILPPLL